MQVFIDTNGCTLGQLQSQRVHDFLERNDCTITYVTSPREADVTVFFACGLTDLSVRASLSMIRTYRSEKRPESELIVWGCLPMMDAVALAEVYDGPVVGPLDIEHFNRLLSERSVECQDVWSNTLLQRSDEDRFCGLRYRSTVNDILRKTQGLINRMSDHHDEEEPFYLRVSEGCNRHCTYCGERLAWGRLKSRPIVDVLSEYRIGLSAGHRRFFLCTEDLGSYGADLGVSCTDLLRAMIEEDRRGQSRLIVDQFNAESLLPNLNGLFEVLASGRIELFSCQVQSGSDQVLKRMGRRYSAADWREGMVRINRAFPDVKLATHIMVGFPGETEEDFRLTMKLLDLPLFLYACRVFVFSPKSGTAAARMGNQVPDDVKKNRMLRLTRKHLYMYALHSTAGRLVRGHH